MKMKLAAMTPDGTVVNLTIKSVNLEHYYEVPRATIKCYDDSEIVFPAAWIMAIRMVEE